MTPKPSNARHKKVIGLDLDGVILNHAPMRLRLAKKRGFTLLPRQTPSSIIKRVVPLPHHRLIQYFLYSHPKVSLETPLMAWSKTGLKKIKDSKTPYFLISRRRESELAVKLLRLRGLWPTYFNPRNVFFVSQAEDKNLKAKELGVTHFFDDEPEVLEKLKQVKNRFLFDQFNVFKKVPYHRVKNWKELIASVLQ